MNLSISATQLFEQLRDKLGLRWLAGERVGGQRVLEAVDTVARRPSLAGYLNIIYPNKVQILGSEELAWLVERVRILHGLVAAIGADHLAIGAKVGEA